MIVREYTSQGMVKPQGVWFLKDEDEEGRCGMGLGAQKLLSVNDDNRKAREGNQGQDRGSARGICYNWVQDPENRFPPIDFRNLTMESALRKKKEDPKKDAEVNNLVEQLGRLQMQREQGEVDDEENRDEIQRLLNSLKELQVSANGDNK